MKKLDFVKRLAKDVGVTEVKANEIFNSFVSIMIDELKENKKLALQGFGKFRVRTRKEKTIRSFSGEMVNIPESNDVGFSVFKGLKKEVN